MFKIEEMHCPQPEKPQEITFPNMIILIDKDGKKIEIPLGEFELTENDSIVKNKDGKWYLQRMNYETFEINL